MTARQRLASGVLGAAGMIAALTLLSRLAGFVRWLVQAWAVGATSTGTAYASANLVPNVLYEIVAGGALAGAVVPLLAVPLAQSIREDVNRIASALLTWVVCALTPVALLVVAFADVLAPLIAGAQSAATLDLTADFLRVFAIQIPLYGIGVVLTGILQAHKRFFWPAFAPLLSTGVVILTYVGYGAMTSWLMPRAEDVAAHPILVLAWGTSAGVAAMSLPLLVPVVRLGVRLHPAVRLPEGVGRKAGALAASGLATVMAQQVSIVVTARVANDFGPPGTFPVYQYANAVYALPYAILAVPIATSVFPRIAEHLGAGRDKEAATLLASSTRTVFLAGVAGAALLAGLAPTATEVFALRGPMPGMTAAVTALAPGVIGFALMFHLTRALYSMHRGAGAVRGAGTGWLLAAAASWALASAFAAGGAGEGVGGALAHLLDGSGTAADSAVRAADVNAATATLTAIGLGSAIGMTFAGLWLLAEVRRAAGRAALAHLPRTAGVALAGGTAGALAARAVVGLILGSMPGILGALVAAVAGALIVVVVLVAAVGLGDRGVLNALRSRR